MKKIATYITIIATLFALLGLSGQTFAEGVDCQHGDEMALHVVEGDSMPCCDEGSCSMIHCLVVVPLATGKSLVVSNLDNSPFYVYQNSHYTLHTSPLNRPPIS